MLSKELDEKHKELLNMMRHEEESLRMLQDEKRRLQTRVRSTPDDRSFEQINREIHECEERLKKLEDEYINTPIVYPTRKLKPIIQYEDSYGNVIKEPLDKQGTFKYYYYPRGQLTAERAVVDVEKGVPVRIRFLEWHSDYGTGLPVTIQIPLEVEPIEFVKVVEKEVQHPKPIEQSKCKENLEEDSDVTQSTNRLSRRFSRFKAESKEILDKILKR